MTWTVRDLSPSDYMVHRVEVRMARRLDSQTWYHAVCCCGQYISGWYPNTERAQRAGRDHASAKNEKTGDARVVQ